MNKYYYLYLNNKSTYLNMVGGIGETEQEEKSNIFKIDESDNPILILYYTKFTKDDNSASNLFYYFMEKCKQYNLSKTHIEDIKYTFNPPFYEKPTNFYEGQTGWIYDLIEEFTNMYILLAKQFLNIFDTTNSNFIENDNDKYFIKNLGLAIIHEYCFIKADPNQNQSISSQFIISQVLENILIYENTNNKIIHIPNAGDVYNTETAEFYEVKSSLEGCNKIKNTQIYIKVSKIKYTESRYMLSYCIYYTNYTKDLNNKYTFTYMKRDLINKNKSEEQLQFGVNNAFGKIRSCMSLLVKTKIIEIDIINNVFKEFK